MTDLDSNAGNDLPFRPSSSGSGRQASKKSKALADLPNRQRRWTPRSEKGCRGSPAQMPPRRPLHACGRLHSRPSRESLDLWSGPVRTVTPIHPSAGPSRAVRPDGRESWRIRPRGQVRGEVWQSSGLCDVAEDAVSAPTIPQQRRCSTRRGPAVALWDRDQVRLQLKGRVSCQREPRCFSASSGGTLPAMYVNRQTLPYGRCRESSMFNETRRAWNGFRFDGIGTANLATIRETAQNESRIR